MCKTIKKCFEEKLTFENLIKAYYRAVRHNANKKEILKFNVDLESNIINILNELKKGNYKTGKYREFKVYEPKERIIKSLPFKDRIVQQWYVEEFIKPYIIPRFINTNCACIEKKGNLYAVNKAQEFMRKMKRKYNNYYVLKCDIKKFFYTIDKDILYNILSKYISDKKILDLTYKFIYDDNEKKGIPIGNYTSQFFANIYLNELDKYIKENLRFKYYIRYMDDFIIFLKTKDECRLIMKEVEKFINEKLDLELNKNSKFYPNSLGVNFCGYIVYETHKLFRKRNKDKFKKNINTWNKLYKKGKLDYKKMILSYNSYISYYKHCNSFNFLNRMKNNIEFDL